MRHIATLPFELIIFCLLLLPTKILVKLQAVCAAWRDLIRDPLFIKAHFQKRASEGNNYILYVPLKHRPGRIFTLLCDKTFEHASHMPMTFEPISMSLNVVGSCNGLLCITDINAFGAILYLYNPSIRKHKLIDFPITNIFLPSTGISNLDISLGFAYHDRTNDYKIIRIISTSYDDIGQAGGARNAKIEIYSMITDSWRGIEVDHFPWTTSDVTSGTYINESIHWKVYRRDDNKNKPVIIAFHLENEVFQEITLPHYEVDGDDLMEYIGILKGNISMFVYHLRAQDPREELCYLWVMKEYGVVRSWSKMYSFAVNPRVITPLMFTQNEEIIFANDEDEAVSYHFGTKTTRSLEVGMQGHMDFVTYMDSLVLLENYGEP